MGNLIVPLQVKLRYTYDNGVVYTGEWVRYSLQNTCCWSSLWRVFDVDVSVLCDTCLALIKTSGNYGGPRNGSSLITYSPPTTHYLLFIK